MNHETFIIDLKEKFKQNLKQYFNEKNIDVFYSGNLDFLTEILEVTIREYILENVNKK